MAPIDPRDALERLPRLSITEQEDIKPLGSPLAEYDPYRRALSPAERRFFQTMPVQQQRPVTAYPIDATAAYTWPQQQQTTQNDASGAAAAPADEKRDGNLAIDPSLSAVRSSTETPAAGSTDIVMASAPEIRLQPETLGSAAASPAPALDNAAANADAAAAVAAVAQSLQAPDQGIKKETPFSRSPELRISHKLAERKRRKEMRDLFDELREQLPADRGMKASKWEILSKAVDYIQHLKGQVSEAGRTIEVLSRDLAIARGENPQTATTTTTAWPPAYHTFNIPYVAHPTTNATNTTTTPAVAAQPQVQAQPQAQAQTQPQQPQGQAAVAPAQPQPQAAQTQPQAQVQPQAQAPAQPQAQVQATPAAPVQAAAAPAPAATQPAAAPQAQAAAPQAAAAQPAATTTAQPQQAQAQAQAPKSS